MVQVWERNREKIEENRKTQIENKKQKHQIDRSKLPRTEIKYLQLEEQSASVTLKKDKGRKKLGFLGNLSVEEFGSF